MLQKYNLNTGDFIRCSIDSIPILQHIGFVVKKSDGIYVYHSTPTSFNKIGGSIVKEPLEEFLESRSILSIEPTNLTEEHIVHRCCELADKKFDLLNFNCEHFGYYIKEGKMYSPQLNNWSLILDKMFNPEDYSAY